MDSLNCKLSVCFNHLCDITVHRFRSRDGRVRVRLTNSKGEHLRRCADRRIADWHTLPPEKLDDCCHWRVDTSIIGDFIFDCIKGLENGGEFVEWNADHERFVMTSDKGKDTVTLNETNSDLRAFLESTPVSCVDRSMTTTKGMAGYMYIDSSEYCCNITVHPHRVVDQQTLIRVENSDGEFLEHCKLSKRAFWKTVETKRFTASHDWRIEGDESGMFITPPNQRDWFVSWDENGKSFHGAEEERDNRMAIDATTRKDNLRLFELLNFSKQPETESEDEEMNDPEMN